MLLGDDEQLKPKLMEATDYVVVPRTVWDLLVEWYGGGPPICRFVIEEGKETKLLRVEVYLLKLRIFLCDKHGSLIFPPHVAYYSKKDRVADVISKECTRLKLDSSKVRAFTMDGDGDDITEPEVFSDPNMLLEEAEVGTNERICLQVKRGSKNEWPSLPGEKGKKSRGFFSRLFGRHAKEDEDEHNSDHKESGGGGEGATVELVKRNENGGLCGPSNLGNKCFMSSGVQAILHCDPMVNYFLSGTDRKELNKKNPLGMKGELAIALSNLMKDVWKANAMSYLAPKQLKHVIGRFAPQFSGYQQHDAHELLAFLLDGVHEDLNRVEKKPYVEIKEAENAAEMEDKELAAMYWGYHEMRNRSVIVDLFHAQLKSTIVCPSPQEGGCSRCSITFDPYSSLSLPFPINERRFVEVAISRDFGLYDGLWITEMPIKYSVEVFSGESIEDVIAKLLKVTALDESQISMGYRTKGKLLTIAEQLQVRNADSKHDI